MFTQKSMFSAVGSPDSGALRVVVDLVELTVVVDPLEPPQPASVASATAAAIVAASRITRVPSTHMIARPRGRVGVGRGA